MHGACSSRGCYSMTDENIQEIYTLGRLAFQGGQREFQVQAFPFRMTPENMAKHRNDPNMPFWLMLKEGYDHFEVIGQPPKVDVCDHRYIFNSVPADGRSFIPSAACPPMSMPEPIRIARRRQGGEGQREDASIAARLDRREGQNGAEALQARDGDADLGRPRRAAADVGRRDAFARADDDGERRAGDRNRLRRRRPPRPTATPLRSPRRAAAGAASRRLPSAAAAATAPVVAAAHAAPCRPRHAARRCRLPACCRSCRHRRCSDRRRRPHRQRRLRRRMPRRLRSACLPEARRPMRASPIPTRQPTRTRASPAWC